MASRAHLRGSVQAIVLGKDKDEQYASRVEEVRGARARRRVPRCEMTRARQKLRPAVEATIGARVSALLDPEVGWPAPGCRAHAR